jgi:hypothetical protein
VLDGPNEDLRRDALDTICALVVALGQDFAIFMPTLCKARAGLAEDSFWELFCLAIFLLTFFRFAKRPAAAFKIWHEHCCAVSALSMVSCISKRRCQNSQLTF